MKIKDKTIIFFMSIVFFVIFGWSETSQAVTIDAASCGQADVQAAVDQSQNGDVVSIPACPDGTSWANTLNIYNKGITLQGAGVGNTIIIADNPRSYVYCGGQNNCSSILVATTLLGFQSRITGIEFRGGPNSSSSAEELKIVGSSTAVRIDHNKFYHLANDRAINLDNVFGVIDHNSFELDPSPNQAIGINHSAWGGHQFGDGSWADEDYAGTDKAIFIEDNNFVGVSTGSGTSPFVDCYNGGRFVYRHNEGLNGAVGTHGTETSQRNRSCRWVEVYQNNFDWTRDSSYWTFFHSRGGTGVVWGNRASGKFQQPSQLKLSYYRSFHNFSPWGACDGVSPYDSNDGTVYDSGTHTGPDGATMLSDGSKNWTAGQWIGYQIRHVAKNTGTYITGNTQSTLDYWDDSYDSDAGKSPKWNTGEAYQILKPNVCIDQNGRGKGDLLSGSTPTPAAWPNQALDPWYQWDNLRADNSQSFVWSVNQTYMYQANRDYYDNIARPGYSPFTYPHSIRTDCTSYPLLCDEGFGDATAPASPTGLTVQ